MQGNFSPLLNFFTRFPDYESWACCLEDGSRAAHLAALKVIIAESKNKEPVKALGDITRRLKKSNP